MAPCQHAFCRACLDQMLRVAQKTDAPCPICKTRIARRSILPGGRWDALAEAFRELASDYQERSGREWDKLASHPIQMSEHTQSKKSPCPDRAPSSQVS